MTHKNGFTLVELAIVLMIIGLLIGGVLKGQELIQNARITKAVNQIRSYDAAAITFHDAYGALPGDISNPSARLANCSAAPCNIAGNTNNIFDNLNGSAGDERNNFWLHLNAANLISGVDTGKTWTSGNYWTSYQPSLPIGSNVTLATYSQAPAAYRPPAGRYGHFYRIWNIADDGTTSFILPVNLFGRIDIKFDDGKPFDGHFHLGGSTCNILDTAVVYDANNITGCLALIKAGF